MSKHGKSQRKQRREADRYLATHAPATEPVAASRGYQCTRCGSKIGSASNQDAHNWQAQSDRPWLRVELASSLATPTRPPATVIPRGAG